MSQSRFKDTHDSKKLIDAILSSSCIHPLKLLAKQLKLVTYEEFFDDFLYRLSKQVDKSISTKVQSRDEEQKKIEIVKMEQKVQVLKELKEKVFKSDLGSPIEVKDSNETGSVSSFADQDPITQSKPKKMSRTL